MIINSLIPVFALIFAGTLLKFFNLVDGRFFQTADRLVYFAFFPALLFLKIGQHSIFASSLWPLYGATLCTLATAFTLSLLTAKRLKLENRSIGAFTQCCYRANTYIAMAIVITAMGDQTAGPFGVYLGMLIPVINVMAVATMVWYSDVPLTSGRRFVLTFKAIVVNPLILACLAGLLYARLFSGFPVFVENTLILMAAASLPLALISIGSALSAAAMRGRIKATVIATVIKVYVFPTIGYAYLRLWSVKGVEFQMGMLFFALSVAPSTYVLVSQLNGDKELSAAVIAVSTLASFFSLSLVLWIFF